MNRILTPRAAAKLKTLRAAAEDMNVLANSANRRAGELRHAQTFAPPSPDARNGKSDVMSAEAAERQAEIERLQSQVGVQHAKHAATLGLVVQIEHFLTTLKPGVRLVDAKPIKIEHQNFQEAVAAVRVEIGELDAELKRAARAAPTKKERHALAERWSATKSPEVPTVVASHAKLEVTFGLEGCDVLPSNEVVKPEGSNCRHSTSKILMVALA